MDDMKTVRIIAKFHRMVPDGVDAKGDPRERKEEFVIGQEYTGPRELMDIWIREHKNAEDLTPPATAEQ